MEFPLLIFIVGPTAVGKTALSLELAERLGRPILSCDSLCFYRGMDIGTAKPDESERKRILHYGVDLVDPDQSYDVARYECYARDCVERHRDTGLVISGGSGFYLKSFFSAVTDQIDIPEDLTKAVQQLHRDQGLAGLVRALQKSNPEGTGNLDLRNPRRVEKALLRCLASGKTLHQLATEFSRLPDPYADYSRCVLLLDRDTQELDTRIAQRTRQMLSGGLVEEVRQLRLQGLEQNLSARDSIGYRETLQFLDGKLDRDTLEAEINLHTRQLVRKQRKWFRRQIPIHFKWNPTEITVESALAAIRNRHG